MRKSITGSIVLLSAALIVTASPQENAIPFEVVSIKPASVTKDSRILINACHGTDSAAAQQAAVPRGRCVFEGTTLENLVYVAYSHEPALVSVPRNQIVQGGPSWARSERFSVEAKAANAEVTHLQLHAMLKTLLADRFKLRLRWDTKESLGYAVVAAKNGPKLAAAKSTGERSAVQGRRSPGHLRMSGQNASIAQLASGLSTLGIGFVVDKTDLQGPYDFTLEFEIDPGMTSPKAAKGGGQSPPVTTGTGPSLFTAIEEQLGLRLVRERVTTSFLVIESAERPSEN